MKPDFNSINAATLAGLAEINETEQSVRQRMDDYGVVASFDSYVAQCVAQHRQTIKLMGKRRTTDANRIDFDAVNSAALACLPAILTRILPGGKCIAGEYVCKNPTRADRTPGSFKVNLRRGRWSDFATGDKGGDAVSLIAYVEGVSMGKAARLLSVMLGMGGAND